MIDRGNELFPDESSAGPSFGITALFRGIVMDQRRLARATCSPSSCTNQLIPKLSRAGILKLNFAIYVESCTS
jgi:hypothetical protein